TAHRTPADVAHPPSPTRRSSDLDDELIGGEHQLGGWARARLGRCRRQQTQPALALGVGGALGIERADHFPALGRADERGRGARRSEEHTSESSHLVISYAVFCLK